MSFENLNILFTNKIITFIQKHKFRTTLAQLESGPSEEDLLFGMSGLGLQAGKSLSLETGQVEMLSIFVQETARICLNVNSSYLPAGGGNGQRRRGIIFCLACLDVYLSLNALIE